MIQCTSAPHVLGMGLPDASKFWWKRGTNYVESWKICLNGQAKPKKCPLPMTYVLTGQ